MRIMTYNVDSGIGSDEQYDWRRSCELIRSVNPDVAALQEVAVRRPNCPPVDYPEAVAAELGMHYEYARTFFFDNGGFFGNMILSRFPLERIMEISLELPKEIEPRKALVVKVLAPKPFCFISTHLPFQGECEDDDALRLECVKQIQRTLEQKALFPCILCGDLNNPPTAPALRFLHESWNVTNDLNDGKPTAKTGKYGWQQIDFICCRPQEAFRILSNRRIEDYVASDHYPIVAEMEII